MKITPVRSKLVRSLSLAAVCGCALATLPLAVTTARAQEDQKEKAAMPQPGDPDASKAGKLNKAEPGGSVKLTAEETLFVKEAGAGNSAEIKMAELALKNAESPDVKEFAQMMIKDHTAGNEELAVVAKNHNIDFPPDAPAKEKALGKKMLDVKGAAFDKAYMEHAVEDHKEDLAEYKKALKELKDPKLLAYAEKTEKVVAHHYEEAKKIDAKLKKG